MSTGEAFHKVLERLKTALFAMGAVFLTCFAAWASGITVPAGSTLNVANGQLNCELDQPCTITNNGIIKTTTGLIRLNGDWTTGAAGYYDSGAGTVFFSAANGIQTITPGTNVSDAFYHLNHVGIGTVAVSTNRLNINGNFSNLAGSFNAGGMIMNLIGNWINSSPAVPSFIHNNNTVNLVGTDQGIYGDTTFYNLDKHLPAAPARTLTLEANRQQIVNHSLIIKGFYDTPNTTAYRLNLVSSNPGVGAVPNAANSARLQLTFGGIQDIANVDVRDNDARGGVRLVGREDSLAADTVGNERRNQNWFFGSVDIKWDGSDDTNWNNPYNWNLGIVPSTGDKAIIRSIDEDNGNAAIARQPVLNVNGVNVGVLEIRQNASLTLDQHNMTVAGLTTNNGTIVLSGTETFTTGTWTPAVAGSAIKYVGVNAAFDNEVTSKFVVGAAPLLTYANLVIDGVNAADTFRLGNSLTVTENAIFTSGHIVLAANTTLTVNGTLTGDGAVIDAGSASIATNNFSLITAGSFIAPGVARTFTLTGDFTHAPGTTFTANGGAVALIGSNPGGPSNQTIFGDTDFNSLLKQITSDPAQVHSLTFEAAKTSTVAHQLTLKGVGGNQLLIVSSNPGTKAKLILTSGGAQDISNVLVQDNNALGGSLLVGRPTSNGVAGTYDNWEFGSPTITWTGAVSTAWGDPFNWDIGTVPIAGDTGIIVPVARQPILGADVTVGGLDVRLNATLTLNAFNFTAASSFINSGSMVLNGNENLNIPLPYDPTAGAFVYRGDGAGTSFNITGAGMPGGRPSHFFDLIIQDPPSGTPSTFVVDQDLYTSGSLDISGAVTVNASGNSVDIAQDFTMTGGTFTAPGSAKSFQIGGDFTHTSGTFTANGGTLTLDGTSAVGMSEQVITGNSTFYNLNKTLPPGPLTQEHRLTLDNTAVQTVTHDLALHGIVGTPLELRSISNDPTPAVRDAALRLQAGGLQQIDHVDVQNSDASGGVALVARDSVDNSAAGFNNTNWIFGIPTITWTGAVSTDWAVAGNWNLGIVPIAGDDVVIAPSLAGNQPHLTAASGALSLRNLTLQPLTTLSLDGYGLAVTGTFSNGGNISLRGTEALAIAVPDTLNGKFTYTGDNTGTPINLSLLAYHDLVITAAAADVFRPAAALVVNGDLTIDAGTLDLSTGPFPMTVAGVTTLNGGVLGAANSSLALGSLVLNGGTLSAPHTGNTFFIDDNWTNTAGVFTTNTGKVTFRGTNPATLTGNTEFYDLAIVAPGATASVFKTVSFTAGSRQTVDNNLEITGNDAHDIVLKSTADGSPWYIKTLLATQPFVTDVDVRDSIAEIAGAKPDIVALNSVDHLNSSGAKTNQHWLFFKLDLLAPVNNRTVGEVPVIIGHNLPGEVVTIKDGTGAVVATSRADVNGSYRVVLGNDDAAQLTVTKTALDISAGAFDRSLTPYFDIHAGNTSALTVVASPGTAQVPVIVSPGNNDLLIDTTPRITGHAKPGQTVDVVVLNKDGGMLLTIPSETYAGTGTVNGSGEFSFDLTRALPRGFNQVSIIVDGVSSEIFIYVIHDIRGTVFDSGSSNPLEGSVVTVLKADGSLPVPGVDIDADIYNPMTTGADGLYSFLTKSGFFKVVIETPGYIYPSTLEAAKMPAGRSVVLGSRGEVFEMTGAVQTIDQPLDPSPNIFKIEKTANKSEARVGEVVTYTVSIESLLTKNTVTIPMLIDVIPPGFKYMAGRAQIDGIPIADPKGNRPLTFIAGQFAPLQKKMLRYQLVIGSGVVPGGYENTAVMKYANGAIISNRAQAVVKVVLDPLFDAGTVFGKVFYDLNENGRQDDPDYIAEDREQVVEGPVPNVRLVMEDGTVVTADKNGQFSVPALLPGRHLLRLDERSLPQGAYLTTDKVQVLDVTPGSIVKVNFGVNMSNDQIVGKDAQFFQKEFLIDQQPSKPVPRLNINTFNENILFHNDAVIEQIEFRMFMNYAPFIASWQLDIIDADTKKLVRSFKGSRANVFDPIYWDGRDSSGRYIRTERKYAYVLKVRNENEQWDETRESLLALKVLTDAEMTERQRQRTDQEKIQEVATRALKYRAFLTTLVAGNTLKQQNIWVKGDTLVLKSAAADVRQVRILKNGEFFTEVPVLQRQGLTARELLSGSDGQNFVPMEVILPDGDYELEVSNAMGALSAASQPSKPSGGVAVTGGALANVIEPQSVATQRYRKQLKVGEDYMMFVAMGDGKVGFNTNKGSIEPIKNDDKYLPGFYSEGKMAYYLKGKVKGKYVVTSSFDTERQRKEALRTFKDEQYYPLYGDSSTVNYDATDTEGPLYLAVDWDKSQAIWGNYAVAFNNTDFANYTRTLYGGKLDYKTVASTPYGEPRTNVVVFHAETHQRTAHNEFLSTGGSLYYLKNQDVVSGTDKMKVEVRDSVTGLVKSSIDLKSGVDYDVDYSTGRVLFWRPVSMLVDNNRLISNGLLNGDPVYVVSDYEYFVRDQLAEATRGARVTQAIGKNVVAGATYVTEAQADRDYQLKGQDVTVHLGQNTTVQAEYAQTSSTGQNNFISTDGGITFAELASSNDVTGKAYGIRQDSRLFDRVGLKSYYKWIDAGYSTGNTLSQQGKELTGLALTFDLTPVTRLTASRDVQRLIDQGNLQTAMQVGAQETTTTMVQLVHDARRLRLTYEFQSTQVKDKSKDYISTTNTQAAAAAFQAEYVLNEKTDLVFRHQRKVLGGVGQATTLGVKRQLTAKMSASVDETVGTDGTATKVGLSANVTPRLALSTDYTLAKARSGEDLHTVTVAGKGNINDSTSLQTAVSLTQKPSGVAAEKTVALGVATKVGTDADVTAGVETTQSSDLGKTRQALSLGGTRRGNEGRASSTGVKIEDNATGGKSTVITAGETGMMNATTQVGTERSFGFGAGGQDKADTYKIAKVKDGHSVETSYARKQSIGIGTTGVSDSNIFGLSGDINDRVALQGTLEKGKVQNVDGTVTDRLVITGGVGYVQKGTEAGAAPVFQSSTKAEVRLDTGVVDKQQVVFYQSAEGKVNDQTSVKGKFSYSTTLNKETKKSEASYKEIMLGAAYRPIAMDRLNVFGEYTYKENMAPASQAATTDVQATKMHVVTAGAALELNEKWELVEKLAMRIMDEKVAGFEFAKTHTWLLINRANYTINRDWKIGAEYRMLTVKEAKDSKTGFLVEAVHGMNDNIELGVGYNFTNFVDDLTNLDYTVQGPFIRMTGKLYDQSPEERARSKSRWLDHRVDLYAKKMIKDELTRKDGPLVNELNKMYQDALSANASGKYEDAKQLYKNIILATQMMYEEAAQFVRQHIAWEEGIYNAFQRAKQSFDKGDFWQARKLWEKIVEEASKAVLE
ncbi:MAG: hypothetical protein HQL17_01415 [Candidatus Omnitrophica bacterium]|nr:hypothetical protein [Candidatus Omnitrophota bacterium]